ncbi:DUF7281 domain-containing protein [Psychromonas ossibalaenae]|uniref:DUF7281 domain-containing protein n=1 Tax=Psychromonas ossibalaenae TaxID=444922 RepID=UPI000366B20E|nr:hypothetical protein [Psychromonas ossibalaenae]
MNKGLYQFCQKKFKTLCNGKLKLSSSLTRLNNEYSFGDIKEGYLHFIDNDRQALIERVFQENGLELFRDPYPDLQSRREVAGGDRNEKNNAYPVSRNYVLVNSLHTIRLNQQVHTVSPFTAFGLTINADQITSIEHQKIVFVENLEIMAVLDKLNMPESLQEALWLYRGEVREDRSTMKAYQFFRRFAGSHQLVCFSDLDPAGIEIALTSGAHHWLTPQDSSIINMKLLGAENEWFNQQKSITYLKQKTDLAEKCQQAFDEMCRQRKTLKQEHMLGHNIKLALYPL